MAGLYERGLSYINIRRAHEILMKFLSCARTGIRIILTTDEWARPRHFACIFRDFAGRCLISLGRNSDSNPASHAL